MAKFDPWRHEREERERRSSGMKVPSQVQTPYEPHVVNWPVTPGAASQHMIDYLNDLNERMAEIESTIGLALEETE